MRLTIFLIALLMALCTATTLLMALRDRRALKTARVNGTYEFWNWQDIRREVLRLTKHAAIVFALFVVIPEVQTWLEDSGIDVLNLRNWIFVFVAIEMGVNSAWDLWARRKHREET